MKKHGDTFTSSPGDVRVLWMPPWWSGTTQCLVGMNVFFLFWFLDVEFLVETSEENSEFHERFLIFGGVNISEGWFFRGSQILYISPFWMIVFVFEAISKTWES